MPAVALAAAVVGTGLQIYGSLKSASDQAGLDRDRASIANQQADEIGQRELANEALRNQSAYRQKLQFASSYAASGKAGVGVGSQLQIQNQSDLQSMMSNREATFQENMLRQQAGIDTTMAGETEAAGTLNALAAGVQGVGMAAGAASKTGMLNGYGGPQSLGSYPSAQSQTLTMPALGSGRYGGG